MAFRIIKSSPKFARMMSTSATTVGFIGLGQMGNRMATNLINKVQQLRQLISDKDDKRLTCLFFLKNIPYR
jgi:hypothetical protein